MTTAATCTENGYTGDKVCTICGETVEIGTTILATGHNFDDGTCNGCGIKLPTVKALPPDITEEKPTKIRFKGNIVGYDNTEYISIISHGLLICRTDLVKNDNLTVNTTGRIKVTFGAYDTKGNFYFTMKPESETTNYTVRAFYTYKNGNSVVTVYSDPLTVTYAGIGNNTNS